MLALSKVSKCVKIETLNETEFPMCVGPCVYVRVCIGSVFYVNHCRLPKFRQVFQIIIHIGKSKFCFLYFATALCPHDVTNYRVL